jgi:hypothetical protein
MKKFLIFLLCFAISACCNFSVVAPTPSPTYTKLPTHTATAPATLTPPPSAATLENYFGNSSCSVPCWKGITPGINTSTEALQMLYDSPLVLKNSIQTEETKTGFGNAHWHWEIGDKQPKLAGNMEWSDGIVRWVNLGAYPIVSIGEVINRYGTPEKIEVFDCTDVYAGDWFCANLYYAKRGFEIVMSWSSSEFENGIQITPSDPVNFIWLFESSTIVEWLSSMGLDPYHRDLRDWKGFGDLLKLYVH